MCWSAVFNCVIIGQVDIARGRKSLAHQEVVKLWNSWTSELLNFWICGICGISEHLNFWSPKRTSQLLNFSTSELQSFWYTMRTSGLLNFSTSELRNFWNPMRTSELLNELLITHENSEILKFLDSWNKYDNFWTTEFLLNKLNLYNFFFNA